MYNFHDVILPEFISVYIKGGPSFSTSVVKTVNGREIRLADRSMSLNKYTINGCRLSRTQFDEFNNFFCARLGMNYSFCLYDYADFKAENQFIGCGDEVTKEFYLVKSYGDEERYIYNKNITKPIKGSVKVYIDDTEVEEVKVDYKTGCLRFLNPLMNRAQVTADFLFYVPVRFDRDYFNYYWHEDGSIGLEEINLIEVSN